MVQTGVDATPGLRERKKLRTRALLIDVAVRLCLAQGYENTTVDQIAAAADVSPRTFSRYFATKDAVYMALLDDFVDAIRVELKRIPADVPALLALRDANIAALSRVASEPDAGLTDEHLARMLQVINSTPELRLAATEHGPNVQAALADRMGLEFNDRRVRLIGAVWAAISTAGCADLVGDVDGVELGSGLMVKRMADAFDEFSALTAALRG